MASDGDDCDRWQAMATTDGKRSMAARTMAEQQQQQPGRRWQMAAPMAEAKQNESDEMGKGGV
jgi:hypothetical protein